MNVDMNDQYREHIGKNVLFTSQSDSELHRGKLQYYSNEVNAWSVKDFKSARSIYVKHFQLVSIEYTRKVSWANCNWAPAHILRIVTQDNLPLYNRAVLAELKLKGYYFKLGGNI